MAQMQADSSGKVTTAGAIALKIDVDTYRGTLEGVPRLAAALERAGARATFLFSVGPDHTGRAIKRVFRRGFLGKVRRTSVTQHYGVKTLLYGVLLPGPHIGRRCAPVMREVAARGFEVGVHTYDHIKWQDGVARASEPWTRRQLLLAREEFIRVFDRPPEAHGAAGWQVNDSVPELERELGFRYASDTRGLHPFMPIVGGREVALPQLPTTLPTLDELIGREDLCGRDPVEHLLARTREGSDQVFTLHAELEGGAYLEGFERLLRAWRARGFNLTDLGTYARTLDPALLPRCPIVSGTVEGRSGTLAVQGRMGMIPRS
ncbi:MAG TPA: polysaccharide deacetylase family protein [Steroidobacteraceae bacterium]|nr:polysaccharide deacetylase family protein [Steroidobacteraceae bacterium]